jgi:hypothetical protein
LSWDVPQIVHAPPAPHAEQSGPALAPQHTDDLHAPCTQSPDATHVVPSANFGTQAPPDTKLRAELPQVVQAPVPAAHAEQSIPALVPQHTDDLHAPCTQSPDATHVVPSANFGTQAPPDTKLRAELPQVVQAPVPAAHAEQLDPAFVAQQMPLSAHTDDPHSESAAHAAPLSTENVTFVVEAFACPSANTLVLP